MMKIQHSILQTLCPIRCILCDLLSDNGNQICAACHTTLPLYHAGCYQCGLPINSGAHCGSCIANPPTFDRTIALFAYQSPITELMTRYKFQGHLSTAKLFANEWINYLLIKKITLPELIIPVPLHYLRLKERGFNQALEIAKPISHYFKIPIDTRSCIRLKNTEAQSHLSAEKRKVNVKNAFALSQALTAKHIAILDDVMTTGSTVREISMLLKKVGVEQIDIYCCTRAN